MFCGIPGLINGFTESLSHSTNRFWVSFPSTELEAGDSLVLEAKSLFAQNFHSVIVEKDRQQANEQFRSSQYLESTKKQNKEL